jgi:hypothetical protein
MLFLSLWVKAVAVEVSIRLLSLSVDLCSGIWNVPFKLIFKEFYFICDGFSLFNKEVVFSIEGAQTAIEP